MQFKILPYGEKALLIQFKDEISLEVHQQVKSCYLYLKSIAIKGIESLIPAYNSLTILFDKEVIQQAALKEILENLNFKILETVLKNQQTITIPVCYDVELGWDLESTAKTLCLSIEEVIKLHTAKPYLVYMLGFTPGFMYLGGLNKQLHIPRKNTPRLKIPAGAVGLADQQTGIYPMETPGGWQIIGQTPLRLFSKEKPALVEMGDLVEFKAISKKEFDNLKQS